MIHRRSSSPITAAAVATLLAAGSVGVASGDGQGDGLVVIRDDLTSQTIKLVQLDDETLVHLGEPDGWRTVALDRCIALFDPQARPRSFGGGLLLLADGQRLPGQAISNAGRDEDVVAWNHAWLGRLTVPLKSIRSLTLLPEASAIEPGESDVVMLANGDRLEGFIVALGDPISLEVTGPDGPEIVDVPLDRAAAVAMVTPSQPPAERRVWFTDGTIINVSSLRVGDDGFVRLSSPMVGSEMLEHRLRLGEIAAVLFGPGLMQPLAELTPSGIAGPESRYVIPSPASIDPGAPLGLSRLEYRGPMVARYALPTGASRFAAEATLPVESRDWGDYELLVRDDDRVVFRAQLDRERPSASINVAVTGTELTIELTEGRHGPIQDRLHLDRAALLLRSN